LKIKINSLILFLITITLWSQNTIDNLVNQLKKTTEDTEKIEIFIKLGELQALNKPNNSIIYFNQAIQLSKKINDNYFIGKSYKALGNFYYEKSDYALALSNFKLAQIYFEKSNSLVELSGAYNNIGNVYLSQNLHSKSYENFLKALRIAEKESYLKGVSSAYNNIGLIYNERGDKKKAIDFYNKSLQIATQLNDKLGISAVNTNIGNIYTDEKKFHLANEYYLKSLKIDTELEDNYGMIICYNNIGEVYFKQGLYSKATEYYHLGIDLALDTGNKSMLAMLNLNEANLHLTQKDYQKATNFAYESLKYALTTNDLKAQSEVYDVLANISLAKQDYKNAYDFQKTKNSLLDSLANQDKYLKVKELDVLFESEEKSKEFQDLTKSHRENEIKISSQRLIIYGFIFLIVVTIMFSLILLKQNRDKVKLNSLLTLNNLKIEEKNNEIVEQHKNLQAANETKDRFFSIIGHDLKNPLNSIMGFSELLLQRIDKYEPEKIKKYLEIIRDSAQRSNELLENLLNWALTQGKSVEFTPERISLKNKIEEVFGLLKVQAERKNIKLQSNFGTNCEVLADKNMVYTILRNLISNAIKFSNSNSEINVLINPKNDFCEITVKDYGVGISEKDIDLLFDFNSRGQLDKKKNSGSGLGLILCKEFVERCGGTISVKSTLNEGSEFIFTLPTYKA